ncbi:hypothetical protein D5S17_25310 [Pseudonocardiaceae bacterium YIM PH 21723]|nr:hypothetical protein D5S17_25310 [Pseudonocardiaceae bacterium YIM PH 21723]
MTPEPVPATTARAAEWIVAAVRHFDHTVGMLLPAVFPAYARVFHPALHNAEPVRWRDIAAANDRTMHPLVQWALINPPLPGETSHPETWGRDLRSLRERDGLWDEEPPLGTLPTATITSLAAVLTGHTGTPGRCWPAVWEGYGNLAEKWREAPRFEMPGRGMHLLSGPVAAVRFSLSDSDCRPLHPSLWWPADHAWCVATDVDLRTTYVGGSVAAIAAIAADPELEALPVLATDPISWTSDTINPRA